MKKHFIVALVIGFAASTSQAQQPMSHEAPPMTEAAPHLSLEPPIPTLLERGITIIQFHTQHIKIAPVYGQAALGVVPRLGHLHVSVDGSDWHWVHSDNEPIVIQGLAVGTHKVLVELADPTHKILEGQSVEFTVHGQPTATVKP